MPSPYARAAAPRRTHAHPACAILSIRTSILALTLALAACGQGQQPEPDAHAEDGQHEEDVVRLSTGQAEAAGVRITKAIAAPIGESLELPAEIRFDPDRLARVAAPISGLITEVLVSEGDTVRSGQTLAIISSRELAELKSDYLDALSAEGLARAEAAREEVLWKERATSEASLQTRRAALTQATSAREAAETKLHAIDIGHEVLDALPQSADGSRANFHLRAPLAGQVILRDATVGEAVGSGEDAERRLFAIADASVVWADIAIYRNDLGRIHVGQDVDILGERGATLASGKIGYVSPVIDQASRTATARVVLDNSDNRLRPGQIARSRLTLATGYMGVSVPDAAIQTIEGGPAVFVPHPEGFEVRRVSPGRSAAGQTEILSGLEAGDAYASEGAFTLKSEMEKSAFGDGHAH